MSKYKYYLCIILWTFMPKAGLAVDLELSDIIKNARELQMQAEKSQIEQTVAQTKEQFAQKQIVNGEQTAIEKLNPEKIMSEQTKSQ